MTTPTTPEQQRLDAFLLRAKYNYGWLNLESSARRMVEHAVDEIEALTKERDELKAAATLANEYIEWVAFGNCRVGTGPIPSARDASDALRKALK